jgi:putative ATP-dependent endonuclease of OLD family
LKTLEPQIAGCNDLALLNRIFGTSYSDNAALVDYMIGNKTECALKIFESSETVIFPSYIEDAVR